MRTLVLCLLTVLLHIQSTYAQQPLDSTFGTNGILPVPSRPGHAHIMSGRIHILSEGKIIYTTGHYYLSDNFFPALSERFFPDGNLDSSYGSLGYVNSPLPEHRNLSLQGSPDGSEGKNVSALQPDGKLLVAFSATNSYNRSSDIYVIRLLPDGSRDSSFGINGERIINLMMFIREQYPLALNEDIKDIALQQDGKIIIGAYFSQYWDTSAPLGPGFIRLLPDGRIDSSFNDSGWVCVKRNESSLSWYDPFVHDIGIDNRGHLFIGLSGDPMFSGRTRTYNMNVLRVLPDGKVDSSYGDNGVAVFSSPIFVSSSTLKVLPDGSALTAGEGNAGNGLLVKFDSTGSIDSSFANNGVVAIPGVVFWDIDTAPDGKIIVAGGPDYAIWRFHPNGSLDSSFGQDGISRLPMHEGAQNTVYTVKCYEGGSHIIAAGNGDSNYMFRYNTPNLSVPGIGASGIKDIELYPNPAHNSLYIQSKTGNTAYDKVQVMDIYGRNVKEIIDFRLEGKVQEIPLQDIAPGTYFISFYTQGKAVERLRFVKL